MTITRVLLFLIVFFAPFGTRYIFSSGEIAGVASEYGTVSIFVTQLFVVAFLFSVGIKKRMQARSGKVLFWVSIFALLTALSVLWSLDLGYAAGVALNVLLGVLFLFALVEIRPRPVFVASVFVFSGVVQAVIGIVQFFSQSTKAFTVLGMALHRAADVGTFVVETDGGRWLRAYGTLPHPNVYGAYLAVSIIIAISLRAMSSGPRYRRVMSSIIAILGVGFVVAFSRSASVGLFFGLAILLLRQRENRVHFYEALRGVVVVFLAMVIIGIILGDVVAPRISGKGRLEVISVSERTSQYNDARGLIKEHFFFGVGAGQMPVTLSRTCCDSRLGWSYQPIHNMHILIMVELGVVGMVVWVAFLGAVILEDVRRHKSFLFFAPGAAFFTLMIIGLFDHFLWSFWQGQILLWIVVGFLLIDRSLDKMSERA